MRISDWSSTCALPIFLDDQHRGPRFAVEFADRIGQQCFDRRLVGARDQPRLFDRKSLERGEQQYLPAERGQLDEALVRGADQRMLFVVAAFAIVDIGAFPDAVKTDRKSTRLNSSH